VLAEAIACSQTLTSRSSVSVDGGVAPHHQSPTSAMEPAGQDPGEPLAPRIDDSTAPIAAECQSFLDNVIAQFNGIWAWNDRRGPNADLASGKAKTQAEACQDVGMTTRALQLALKRENVRAYMRQMIMSELGVSSMRAATKMRELLDSSNAVAAFRSSAYLPALQKQFACARLSRPCLPGS
jgi:hypothetical protein